MADASTETPRWAMGLSERTGTTGFIRVVTSSTPDQFQTERVHVGVTIRTTGRNGFPDEAEEQQLLAIEQGLVATIPTGSLFAATTADGQRDFLFYCSNRDELAAWAPQVRSAHPEYTITFKVASDPRHEIYKMFRAEAEHAQADRLLVDTLLAHGVGPDEEHRLEHFLHFPDERSSDDAIQRLRDCGYEVELPQPPASPEDEWIVLVPLQDYVQPIRIAHYRCQLATVAEEYGGRYDGWGSPIVGV